MSNDVPEGAVVDARKLALEALATLVNVKRIAADRLLRPAGIADRHIKIFLKGKDTTTGDSLTKRQAGALIFDELSRSGQEGPVIRALIDIVADWKAFDLAQDEFKARAVVEKARALKGILVDADARERKDRETAAHARAERQQREREELAQGKRAAARAI
jgi:hypothetical protein